MIAAMSGAVVTGWLIIILVFGTIALRIWHHWSVMNDREQEIEWYARFEPNRDGHLTPHTHPDEVGERPVLSAEYPPVPDYEDFTW